MLRFDFNHQLNQQKSVCEKLNIIWECLIIILIKMFVC